MTELFRYIAVHNPIDYNQSMNDAGAIKRRLCKYLLPVLAASILFNVPKFLEGTFFSVTRMVKKSYRKKSFFLSLDQKFSSRLRRFQRSENYNRGL